MKKLVSGYEKFRADVFPAKQKTFESLAGEQHPRALFITCADSRILPEMIMQSDPGELFIQRNAGNIVPPYGERMGGVSATIEYGVLALNVRHIVVCGHSDCGAMRGVLHPEQVAKMPTVASWLMHGELARRIVEDNYGELAEEEKLNALIHENVLAQLDHLRTHPAVASRLKSGDLQLHGWVYEIHTGAIEAYEAETESFVPLHADHIPLAIRPARTRLAATAI
ncbi:MAG: carbonic anhydrase [Bryobacterales bacterium]|nr:carbonic anhydrase [Bryobacterales bacterium]